MRTQNFVYTEWQVALKVVREQGDYDQNTMYNILHELLKYVKI